MNELSDNVVDYKDTLNLPKTPFPMRANLPNREPNILKKWYDTNLYQQIRARQKGQEKYVMNDGPPYANGDIHIGHAVNKILKDIVVKAQTLNGKDAPFIPGWDCHGLPIELNVEKKKGKPHVDMTPEAFRQACREYAASQVDLQRESFKRLGVIADWDNPYLTMDYSYQADIMRGFGAIYANGHVQQGVKPVHWCTVCGSALAEAEVEYQDKTSPAIDVGFKVVNLKEFADKTQCQLDGLSEIAFVIWTTTPWTLPANQAVALNPELPYVIVKVSLHNTPFQALVVNESLLETCMARFGLEEFTVLGRFQGAEAEHLQLQHPFYDRQVPVVIGGHVTVDAGTGAVHTAPAHGMDDYHLGLRYKLPLKAPVDDHGKFYDDCELVAGQHVFKANDAIIQILQDRKALVFSESINHSYPHCWRHKKPLIFRATQQWFISMDEAHLREKTLSEIKKVKWVPDWGESRINLMVEGRPDWCISRQRTWGVPLPLVLRQTDKMPHPNTNDIIEHAAKLVESKGVDAWFNLSLDDLPFDTTGYIKSTDTLDVWFDSGVSHLAVMKRRKDLQSPADVFLEGSDQHRGWFQSSILTAVAIDNKAPFKAVLTHGFTVDQQGRKMSKSLGNVVAPDKVIKQLGADVLRLWVAATDYKGELHVSDEILKRTSDAYRRIRNTARFLLGNISDFDPSQAVPFDDMVALDQWIVSRASVIQAEIIQAFNDFQFHSIYQKLHNFCVLELGSFYLDVIKDRQYTVKTDCVARRSAQTAMYHVMQALVRWMAPILSFTAEEIYELIPNKQEDSVFFTTWYEGLQSLPEDAPLSHDNWEVIIKVRECVNKAIEVKRQEGVLGSALEAEVTLFASDATLSILKKLGDELRFVLITSEATVDDSALRSNTATRCTELDDLWCDIKASQHEKCVRCWHRREDVNQSREYPKICGRCIENIAQGQQGERRLYA